MRKGSPKEKCMKQQPIPHSILSINILMEIKSSWSKHLPKLLTLSTINCNFKRRTEAFSTKTPRIINAHQDVCLVLIRITAQNVWLGIH